MIEGRVLGIDYGEKRVGIALSDPLGMMALPQPYLPNSSQLLETLKTLVLEKNVRLIVLGLPKAMSGQDSKKTLEVRAFAQTCEDELKLPIVLQDERLSSKAVERQLIQADVSRKKRKEAVDSMAAAFILQGYLDSQG